jgi:hypothetical protein
MLGLIIRNLLREGGTLCIYVNEKTYCKQYQILYAITDIYILFMF